MLVTGGTIITLDFLVQGTGKTRQRAAVSSFKGKAKASVIELDFEDVESIEDVVLDCAVPKDLANESIGARNSENVRIDTVRF